jgi:hypothetical protein
VPDVLLMYGPDFFKQYCNKVLDDNLCQKGEYVSLDGRYQAMIRGMVLEQADISCPECENHIDINKANDSVDLFCQIV